MINKLLKEMTLIFFTALVAFLITPIFMIGNDPRDYYFIVPSVFFDTAIIYVLSAFVLLSSINIILNLTKLKKTSVFYTHFIFSYIVFSGLILPVSISTGMVDPKVNPIDLINLVIVIIFAFLIGLGSLTALKKYFQVFLITISISSFISSVISINQSELKLFSFHKTNIQSKNQPALKLSNYKNILIIGFDGLMGEMVTDMIKNNDNLMTDFKDFTIFENAVSQAPATYPSLLGDILGTMDYKSKANGIKETVKILRDEGYFNDIPAQYIKDSYQYSYGGFQIKPMSLSFNDTVRNTLATVDFFKYSITRIGTKYSLILLDDKINVLKSMNKKFKDELISNNENINANKQILETEKRFVNHNGQGWDQRNILQIYYYDNFVSNLTSTNKELSLRYMHFVFTHYPVDFDEQCQYRSDDPVWYAANQNEHGLKNQTVCALKKFTDFIDKLKELNIYDKSLIILKSDHGEHTYHFSSHPYNLKINGRHDLGYSKYRPMLMIKDFDSNNSTPSFKSELVLLNDIARTICEKSGTQSKCEKYEGINLFNDDLVSDQPYYLYVVKDKYSTYKHKEHISVEIPTRNISLLEAMENSELIELSTPLSDQKQP